MASTINEIREDKIREEIRKDEIRKICSLYGINRVTGIALLSNGFANQNYKITTEKERFFYRICTQQADEGNILYEVDILLELKKIHFPTAYLVQRNDGGFISDSTAGKVLIYEFKAGTEPELNHQTAAEIARCMARLNSLEFFEKYPRKNVIHMDHCVALIDQFQTAKFQYPDIYTYFKEQTRYLMTPLSKTLPQGLIHGDVFPDNTLFHNGKLSALIDFEEVCVDSLLMEIGMCINGFCFINNELDLSLMESFLAAYHQIRPITQDEFGLLHEYIQWAAHGMISWHLRYFLIHRKNPKQLKRVQQLMQRVKTLRKNRIPEMKRP